MRKLPPYTAHFLVPLIVTFCMTGIVSATSLLRSFGFTQDMLDHWPAAWFTSWVIAFPTLLFLLPATRRFVARITG